jgi:hypothetical protein
MGINDEYSRDAYDYELAYDSDDSVDSPDPLHPEDWQDWYSEQLLDAWMSIRNFVEDQYLHIDSTYPEFINFVMEPMPFHTQNRPRQIDLDLWNLIKDIQVIQEKVTLEQFTGWVGNILEYDDI